MVAAAAWELVGVQMDAACSGAVPAARQASRVVKNAGACTVL